MVSSRVLRLSRSDESGFILLHVSNTGPAPLDLTLTATEGECPYTTVVKQSSLKDLRFKNYQGSDEEWSHIISFVLGQSAPDDESASLSGIETSTSIEGPGEENKKAMITIRKRVQAITQRLGSIVLKQDDEQAIELFEWSGIATARVDALETQLSSLTDRYRVAESTIHQLGEQLSQLMKAKEQHEDQLVANFVVLLNEKKLKIRNQQRLLSSATVNPDKVAGIKTAAGQPRGVSNVQRAAKRRPRTMGETNGDSDEEVDGMEIDQTKDDIPSDDQAAEDGGQSTPQPLEEEEGATTTDDEEVESAEAAPSAAKELQPVQASGRPPSPKEAPPPRRDLPFIRRDSSKMRQRSEPPAEETAGETDDDEL